MIFRLYNAATRLAGPLLDRLLEKRLARGKEDPERISERRGIATLERPTGRVFWVHGASVGECQTALALINRLLARDPSLQILLTSGTRTSAELMTGRLPERALHQFIPIDHPHWIARFLDHWQPSAAVFVESDLWPNLVLTAQARNIPLVLANARMSKSSFARWRRFGFLTGRLFQGFSLILASNDQQMESFKSLTDAPVISVGNLKRAAAPLTVDKAALDALKKATDTRPVFLAASTHDGEDLAVLDAHRRAAGTVTDLLTIIVPRHPNRGSDIAALAATEGFQTMCRSSGSLPNETTDIYVADTLGEMGSFFKLADTVFVAGSLIPVGGHNPLEPAYFGKPVLFGPLMANNADIAADMIAAGAAEEVEASGLGDRVAVLMGDSPERSRMTSAALAFAQGQGRIADDMAERILATASRTGETR
ncbi:3-deoxy-D-manno-octulosonic acid transferase [Nisaea sp.]|uniref:3-deoxy-D-manno-octulosonic acid transferase n=1 Tax=Nisaea sp. TaxID=2024842 RepID=UPI003265C8C0